MKLNLVCETHVEFNAYVSLIELYWQSELNRRMFFVNFAKANAFDPLIAENWYTVQKDQVTQSKVQYTKLRAHSFIFILKGGSRVLYYSNNSVPKALVELFPDIGLDKTKFEHLESNNFLISLIIINLPQNITGKILTTGKNSFWIWQKDMILIPESLKIGCRCQKKKSPLLRFACSNEECAPL